MFDSATAMNERAETRPSLFASKGFLISCAAIGLVVQLLFALPIYQWYDRLLAWSLLLISLFVCRRFAVDREKHIPVLALMVLQFYVMYGFAQFGQDSLMLVGGIYVPPAASVTTAMLMAVGACLALLGGFRLGQWLLRKSPRQLTDIYPEPERSWRFPHPPLRSGMLGGVFRRKPSPRPPVCRSQKYCSLCLQSIPWARFASLGGT